MATHRRHIQGRPMWIKVYKRGGVTRAKVGTTAYGLNPVRAYRLTHASTVRLLRLAYETQQANCPDRIVYVGEGRGTIVTIHWRLLPDAGH